MSYIVSLDLKQNNNDEFSVQGIIFDNNSIKEFLNFPTDYTMKDIVKIILQKGYINMFSTCLIDQRGFGIMLYEELKLQTSHILGLSLIPINYSANEVYTFVSTCDSQLNNIIVNLALNSHLDAINNIEFIKMYNEINELKDIKLQLHQSNQFRLELKNKQRAICLLWYLIKYPIWRNI